MNIYNIKGIKFEQIEKFEWKHVDKQAHARLTNLINYETRRKEYFT